MIYFFSVLIIFFIFVLFYPFRFEISYNSGNLVFKCKILFFCWRFESKKSSVQEGVNCNKTEKKDSKEVKEKRKIIKNYKKFIKILVLGFKELFSSMVFFCLKIKVSAADSAAVALWYSVVCSLFSFLLNFVFENKLREKSVFVLPDFSCDEKNTLAFNLKFSIRSFSVLRVVTKTFLKFLKGGVFNERKTA